MPARAQTGDPGLLRFGGVALTVGITILMFAFMHGNGEQNRIALARTKTGPGYRYL